MSLPRETLSSKPPPSPSPSTKLLAALAADAAVEKDLESERQREEETDRRLGELQQEVSDLRSTHLKMEEDLRRQIEQLEKDRDKAIADSQKKGGGCVQL